MPENSKSQNIQYFYFAPLEFDTVFKTQVIGSVNLYREYGLDFSIVKVYQAKHILNQHKRRQDIKGIRKLYDGRLYVLYIFPDRFFCGSILNLIIYILLFFKSIISNRKLVLQTRGIGLHSSLGMLKKLYKNRIKIIYDARAAAAEEFKYNNEPLSSVQQQRYCHILQSERRMGQLADRVFTVSYNLKSYLLNQVGGSRGEKFYVNPCNADSKYFYFDENERLRQRQILNLSNRFVVVYSGGLECSWHVPQKIFSAFLAIKDEIPDAFFLLLTHDLEFAEKLQRENHINNNDIVILSIDNVNVRPYLNAGDVGLIIRDDVPMNNVASPTKFAEYVMCGLPIIISPGVGDFSELVETKKYGFVYQFDIKTNFKQRFAGINLPLSLDARMELSHWGITNFSKQSNIMKAIDLYTALFKDCDPKQ
jgi:glycosyltransferase involved in cell wall biosynthesis